MDRNLTNAWAIAASLEEFLRPRAAKRIPHAAKDIAQAIAHCDAIRDCLLRAAGVDVAAAFLEQGGKPDARAY